jgi:hypothetical protein
MPHTQRREDAMRRTLVIAAMLTVPATAGARTVTVDGDPAEWTLTAPGQANLAHLARSAAAEGEWVWVDVVGDERTDFAAPDGRVDLREVRITGDETNLCFLARFSDIDQATGNGAPLLEIAIDVDGVAGSGEDNLAGFADTTVTELARWERLIATRFGSGNTNLRVYVGDGAFVPVMTGAAAIDAARDVVEGCVLWADLGLPQPPPRSLRFTVATFRANGIDDTWDTGGEDVSNALDVVTAYRDPGDIASNTFAEVGDGVIDHSFEVWFGPDGEPYAPLLLSEVLYDSGGSATGEFIEIYNASPGTLGLGAVKVGDEETIGGFEGMEQFPEAATIAPGQALVIANEDRKSTRLNSSHRLTSRMPSSA